MLKFARLLRDPSWVFLLIANGIVLIRLAQGTLDSTDLIWTYWMQSMIMVFTWSLRLKWMGYDAPGSAVDLGIDIHVESGGVRRNSFDFSGVQGFLIVGLGFFTMYFALIYFLLGATTNLFSNC